MKPFTRSTRPNRNSRSAFWLLSTAALLLTGCGKTEKHHSSAQPDLAPVQVRTQPVENKKLAAVEEVLGTIRAKLRATIEAKTSGRIAEMPVVLGQKIHPGQLLARLDAPEIKARLQQAEAALQQAEREWKRAESLFNQQATTRADLDSADARYLVAKAAVAEAKAMLSYVEILAPFEGVVTRKWSDVGDLATPGKPLIDMEDPTRLQLDADVPEAIAGKIKQDARMSIRLGQNSGEFSGTVAEMAPVADPASRTLRIKLDLPEKAGIMSGQFARLVVPVGETTSLRIPASAVLQRGQMEIVFAVEDQRARLHLVKTGRRLNDETEILSGLEHGERVVVENVAQLVDGQPIEVK